MEKRQLDCVLRASSKNRIVGVVPTNSVSDTGTFKEVLKPGSWVIDDSAVALWSHNQDMPIASKRAGTLRVWEETDGYHVELRPALDTTWGKDALNAVRAGNVGGFSFGMVVDEEQWNDHVREIHKARIHEVSPVVFPVYNQGTISVRNKDMSNNIEVSAERFAEFESWEDRVINLPLDNTEDRATKEQGEEFRAYLRGETRAMSSGSDADGGYITPQEFQTTIDNYLYNESPFREMATNVKVYSSQFSVPHNEGGLSSNWVPENGTRTETDSPEISISHPLAFEIYSLIKVSNWLVQDATFDLEQWLAAEAASQFAWAEEQAFIAGDGATSPSGILSYDRSTDDDGTRAYDAIKYLESTAAGAADHDSLRSMMFDLRSPYRKNAHWC